MNSPLVLEHDARWHQEVYQREAAAERLALQARQPSASLRARLSVWLYALARRLASEAQPVAHSWTLPDRCPGRNGVEYWPSA
jgi:hypothetical protein